MVGDPVSGKQFVNRKNELDLLDRRLTNFKKGKKRNLALIGLRKMGKSSLIIEFLRKNKHDKLILPILIYLPERNPKSFIIKSIGSAFYSLVRYRNIKYNFLKMDIEELINVITRYYPDSSNYARTILKMININLEKAFNSLFDFFNLLQKESKLKVIIILDEFQRLVEYNGLGSQIDTFREKIMQQKNLWYVISGSSVGMLNKLVKSSDSPLYGHFETYRIREFDYISARKLIRKRIEEYRLSEEKISFLIELTNGIPYYLDVLIFRMIDLAEAKTSKTITNEIFIDALVIEMFGIDGAIYSYMNSLIEENLEKRGFGTYINIMKAIAKGYKRASEISKDSGIVSTTLPRYLKKLIELDLLKKRDEPAEPYPVYYFIDPIFDLWLNEVYSLREDSFITELNAKRRSFRNKMGELIETFKRELGKGNEARVRELFSLFNNRLNIYGKTLPKFDKVIQINDEEEIDIFASKGRNVWIGEVTDKFVDNSKFNKFIKKIKFVENKRIYNIEQKVLIALFGIEKETKEKCGKSGILVWTLDDVNYLMKHYSKPRIFL